MTKPHNRGGHVTGGYTLGRTEDGLTRRENQVLERLLQGMTRVQIQADLGLTKQRISALCKSIEGKGVELPKVKPAVAE